MPRIMYQGTKDGRKPQKYKRTYIKRFPDMDLKKCLEKHNYRIPLKKLIEYGNKCNWTTSLGKPFFNIDSFCWFFNNIYLKEVVEKQEEEFKSKYIQTYKNNLL